jgi:hypothetical protein
MAMTAQQIAAELKSIGSRIDWVRQAVATRLSQIPGAADLSAIEAALVEVRTKVAAIESTAGTPTPNP